MPHFVPQLRHGVVVGQHFSLRRTLPQLIAIESDITIRASRCSIGWILLHLVGADVHGLYILPLEPALAAVGVKVVLSLTDTGYIAADWTIARGSRLLVVNAEIRVVRKEIEFVAQSVDDRASKIVRAGRSSIMKSLVHGGERTILAAHSTEVRLRILQT